MLPRRAATPKDFRSSRVANSADASNHAIAQVTVVLMVHETIELIAQYGLLIVFLNVLVEQVGFPVPSLPTLVVAGAQAVKGHLSLQGILLVALAACLVGDLAWYWAGRHFGARIMHLLCRFSFSPASCVHQSEVRFERWRGRILVVAKFMPGVSLVTPPLVGALGLKLRVFLFFDSLGALLWVTTAVGLGYVFSEQIDMLLAGITVAGKVVLEAALGLLAIFLVTKWWRRRRLLASPGIESISVAQLHRMQASGRAPVVIDVRSTTSRLMDPWVVSGALLGDIEHIDRVVLRIPPGREIVTYCNCPSEVTSARAAKTLIALGYRHVRPLKGGLAAWTKAGHAIWRLPLLPVSGKEADHSPRSIRQRCTQTVHHRNA